MDPLGCASGSFRLHVLMQIVSCGSTHDLGGGYVADNKQSYMKSHVHLLKEVWEVHVWVSPSLKIHLLFYAALNFELSESDYSVRDDVLSVEVTSSGRHNGVTVQIISLAISVYVQQYPDQPCGAPEDILTGPNLAADSKNSIEASLVPQSGPGLVPQPGPGLVPQPGPGLVPQPGPSPILQPGPGLVPQPGPRPPARA